MKNQTTTLSRRAGDCRSAVLAAPPHPRRPQPFLPKTSNYTGPATSLTDTNDCDPLVPNGVIVDDNPLGLHEWHRCPTDQLAGPFRLPIPVAAQRHGGPGHLPNASSGTSYRLDYWVYVVREATSSQSFYIVLRGEGADINGDDLPGLPGQSRRRTRPCSDITTAVGPERGAWVNTTASQAPDTWQHHRFVIDPNAMTFTFIVDDMVTPVVTGGELSRCEVGVPTVAPHHQRR